MYLRITLLTVICCASIADAQDSQYQYNNTVTSSGIYEKLSTCSQFDTKHMHFCEEIGKGMQLDHLRGRQYQLSLTPKLQKYRERVEIPADIQQYLEHNDVTRKEASQLVQHIIQEGADEALQVALRYIKPDYVECQDGSKMSPRAYAQQCYDKCSSDKKARLAKRDKIVRILEYNR